MNTPFVTRHESEVRSNYRRFNRFLAYPFEVFVAMTSIDADMSKIQSLSEDLPSSVWTELLTMIVYILKRRWFGNDGNEAEELLEAMQNGNTERVTEIIEGQEESEDIKDTIGLMCDEISETDEVDHEKIESLERWAE